MTIATQLVVPRRVTSVNLCDVADFVLHVFDRSHIKNLRCFGNAKIGVAFVCYTQTEDLALEILRFNDVT